MAVVTASASLNQRSHFSLVKHSTEPPNVPALYNYNAKSCFNLVPAIATSRRRPLFSSIFAEKDAFCEAIDEVDGEQDKEEEVEESSETLLYSFSPLPLMLVAALPGAGAVRSLFGPFVELVKSWNLPNWLVHWAHPGNMAVVLFAMGGYGTYLGFRIHFSDDLEEKANAKDLHPKLLGGMFFFFAFGATGGITSLLTSDKPIFESPHCYYWLHWPCFLDHSNHSSHSV